MCEKKKSGKGELQKLESCFQQKIWREKKARLWRILNSPLLCCLPPPFLLRFHQSISCWALHTEPSLFGGLMINTLLLEREREREYK